MTESFTYNDMVSGRYGKAPEEQRIHVMDEAEMTLFCQWRARAKMVTDYKRYLALNKRAFIVGQNLVNRWELERELYRIYVRYAVKEEEFDQTFSDLTYHYKKDVLMARNRLSTFMQHLDPIRIRKLDPNLKRIWVKTYNFPQHWRACGYRSEFSELLDAKKRILTAYRGSKNRPNI